jgi:hypothetical protein
MPQMYHILLTSLQFRPNVLAKGTFLLHVDLQENPRFVSAYNFVYSVVKLPKILKYFTFFSSFDLSEMYSLWLVWESH